jgi:hypothetical protein
VFSSLKDAYRASEAMKWGLLILGALFVIFALPLLIFGLGHDG